MKTPSLIKSLRAWYSFRKIARLSKRSVLMSGREEVFQRLSEGVQYIHGMAVAGDIAEFGTMSGGSAVALASALNQCSQSYFNKLSQELHGIRWQRKLLLLDSFEGLPTARFDEDKLSPHVSSGVWGRGSCKGLTPEQLLSLCSKYLDRSRIRVIKGWFKDIVPESITEHLALIHVDGDLYESAIDALDPLFKKKLISEGALIFFDDWNCNHADPRHGERKAWLDLVQKYNIIFSDEGSYGIACHRFIIHDYS